MTAPLFSIVTPVYNPPIDVLRDMIDAVRAQTFADWELILVDDVSPDPAVRETLRASAAADSRIVVVEREENGHIVAASNDGIERARGEFVVLVDHDDLITANALKAVARAIEATPTADYLYSDEDKVDAEGNLYDTFRKPDWSPERLRGHMYTGHLSVLRTSLVRAVGGFREGFDGSQDHDLVLRVTERARDVVHLREVLYHWRVVPGSAAGDPNAKPYAWIAGRKAVQEHLDRLGVRATAQFAQHPSTYRIVRDPVGDDVLVSVIIPTRGGAGYVWGERRVFVIDAVRSLLERGGHRNLEIVVVYDAATPSDVLDGLRRLAGERLVLVAYDRPFNYSEKCNLGVLASHGGVILLLNDDIEVIAPGFVTKLVAPLSEPGVGMTGARLLYSDNTIQHAGVAVWAGNYVHRFRKALDEDPGGFVTLCVDREVSALTAACAALTRGTYERAGGLSEQLPVNFNDVDLSLKVGLLGLRRLWIAEARAYHFESQTREVCVEAWEPAFMVNRWHMPDQDPYLPE
ncbi:glycosyltransferase family 2 protein [Xylanimonas ulmi]|uniref:Glycosyl transferase family 2 n=1 Tax=Xylanimonas ulmi TaxID=228973 RepID=A0A4Q7LXX7_9MICO|nr:glycosyltransferase [Xylanibacterium ulmi]RZS59946.1 glycosyl transferase family 2 [Xylanibacterium ulmi]